MKNLFLVFLVATSIAFTSCKKEKFEPIDAPVEVKVDDEISLFGKWELVSGVMYVENIETHEKKSYNHFDNTKTVSSLRYDGSEFEFETIEAGVTTWTFKEPKSIPGYGEFLLNDDTNLPYGLYITKSNWTIVEHPTATTADEMHLGGSARPISAYIVDYTNETVNFYVQEAYTSIDGYNHKYFSELTFKKVN